MCTSTAAVIVPDAKHAFSLSLAALPTIGQDKPLPPVVPAAEAEDALPAAIYGMRKPARVRLNPVALNDLADWLVYLTRPKASPTPTAEYVAVALYTVADTFFIVKGKLVELILHMKSPSLELDDGFGTGAPPSSISI